MSVQKTSILVVDDNRSILSALEILLVPEFGEVTLLSNPNQIISELTRKDYNLVILDMNFTAGIKSGNEGIFWLGKIRESNPDISAITSRITRMETDKRLSLFNPYQKSLVL